MELHLIGLNHGPKSKYLELQFSLMSKASREEIVYGIEGHIRDDKYEKEYMNDFNYKKGFFYGLDNEMTIAIGHIFAAYWIFGVGSNDEHNSKRKFTSKGQLLVDFRNCKTLSSIWNELENEILLPEVSELCTIIERFNYITKNIPLKLMANTFKSLVEEKNTFKDDSGWFELYKKLANISYRRLEKLPNDKKPDLQVLRSFLDNKPTLENQLGILKSAEWRDIYLKENIKYVAEQAINKNLNGYFNIGSIHYEPLLNFLNSNFSDVVVKGAFSHDNVPDEYEYLIEKKIK